MKAVFDSDVLIDFLQGKQQAKEELSRYDEALFSVVSMMEILCGAHDAAARQGAQALFASLKRVELSVEIALLAVELRQKLGLKLPDAIILATAQQQGCLLITRNTKDFDSKDPMIHIPYKLG